MGLSGPPPMLPQPCRQLGTQTHRPGGRQKQTMVVAGAGPLQHTHTIRVHPNKSKASLYKHPSLPRQTQREDRRLAFTQTQAQVHPRCLLLCREGRGLSRLY